MSKRKNDVLLAWQKWAKRLSIVMVLFGVVTLGAGVAVLSKPATSYDADAIMEYISFPREARIFEPFCFSIDGLGDSRLPTGFLTSSDIWETEIYIDGLWVSGAQFDTFTSGTLVRAVHWCYPYGLDRGEHEMSLKLKTAAGDEIATYSWMLTVDQTMWSDKQIRSKIAQMTTQEQYMPQRTMELSSITRETTASAPICITAAVPAGMSDYPDFMTNYLRWSTITINGVRVSSSKITTHTYPSSHRIEFCLNEGLPAGQYVAALTLKSYMSDPLPQVYEWVLTVNPGESRGGCGRDH